jgi:hypothetical protein
MATRIAQIEEPSTNIGYQQLELSTSCCRQASHRLRLCWNEGHDTFIDSGSHHSITSMNFRNADCMRAALLFNSLKADRIVR